MEAPIAPGPRRPKRAPLPTMSLMVGGTLCVLAVVCALAPSLVASLAQDRLVVRALGVTAGFAGYVLGYVAIRASAGARRMAALLLAAPLLVLGVVLLIRPELASYLHDTGRTVLVPWVFGVPGVLALMLSRWRVQ